jgi:hypothetical protein
MNFIKRPRKRQGRCYELAWKHQSDDERFSDWTLVHGEVRGPEGAPTGHAWLESPGGEWTYCPVIDKTLARVLYRRTYAARRSSTWTRKEAAQMALTHGHFGPWP